MSQDNKQDSTEITISGQRGLSKPTQSLVRRGLELAKLPSNKKTVLVVGADSCFTDEIVGTFLRDRRHCDNFISAQNGSNAFDLFLANRYSISLVVSQIYIAGLNGFELLSEIKKLNPDTPVIFMASFIDRDNKQWDDLVARADAFFEMPFKLAAFDECIEKLIK